MGLKEILEERAKHRPTLPLLSEEQLKEEPHFNSLYLFLLLCYKGNKNRALETNGNDGLMRLANWLAPFPAFSLEEISVPNRFLQSYLMYKIQDITGIPSGILWKDILRIAIEEEKNSLT